MRHDLFNYFDTNKDGFLTKEEMVDNNYHAMDHNGRLNNDQYYTLTQELYAVHFVNYLIFPAIVDASHITCKYREKMHTYKIKLA